MSDYCKCWRTEWEYDMMADDKGVCKHCGLIIEWFLVPRTPSFVKKKGDFHT